jgi:fibronectin-binding autotransporter adhesin
VNTSANLQTVNLGWNESGSQTLDAGAAGMNIGGTINITANTNTLTLLGTGTLTNSFTGLGNVGVVLNPNDTTANWTILNNASLSAVTVPAGGVNILNGGTLNFGSASSAPSLIFSTGWGTDNILGNTTGISALNMTNGTLTLPVRLDAGNANLNIVGGTLNIWNQLQWVNAIGNVGTITVNGGTLDVLNSAGTSTAGGIFYLAVRGTGTLTINGGLVECSTFDLSRNASSDSTVGLVNLNGGTLQINGAVTNASNAQGPGGTPTATFNFNGGILKANKTGVVPFQGSTTTPIIPIISIVQSNGAVIQTASGKDMIILEPLQHDGNLGGTADGGLTKNSAGVLTLTAANTYSGSTTISGGTLALTGNGSIANSAAIKMAAGATFDVSGLTSLPFILNANQTLSGFGTVNGAVTTAIGSTIAPGSASTIGILTILGNVNLGGTNAMKLSKSPTATNDVLSVNGTLTLGGTLNVSILSGTLAANDTFTLFNTSGGISSGSFFTATNLPSLGAGLAWDTSNLANGILTVVASAKPTPQITGISLSGTNLVFNATNGLANAPFNLLTSTNIALPLNQWTTNATGAFDNNGNLVNFTNGITPNAQQQFYILSQ